MPHLSDQAEVRVMEPWSEPGREALNHFERKATLRAFVLANILIVAILAIFIGALAVVNTVSGVNYIAGVMPGVLAASTFLAYFIILREEMPRIATERFFHSLSLAAGQIVLCTALVVAGLIIVGLGVADAIPGHANFARGPLLIGLLMSPAGAIAAALIATAGLPDAGTIEHDGTRTSVVSSDELT